jgi:hypothetical protein
VLKGGVLLAAYDARRPTRDVDIQARAITGDRDDVLRLVRDIAAGAMDDGLVFDTDAATADIIRDAEKIITAPGYSRRTRERTNGIPTPENGTEVPEGLYREVRSTPRP